MIGSPLQALTYAMMLDRPDECQSFLRAWSEGHVPEWAAYYNEWLKTEQATAKADTVTTDEVEELLREYLRGGNVPADLGWEALVHELSLSILPDGIEQMAAWLKTTGYGKAAHALNLYAIIKRDQIKISELTADKEKKREP